jgi:hypothetical protein
MAIALSARDRWHGMRRHGSHGGLVFRGSGAHGYGLTTALTVVGIDAAGRVISCRLLNPRGRLRIQRAVWLVELPVAWPRPQPGTTLMWRRARSCSQRRPSAVRGS